MTESKSSKALLVPLLAGMIGAGLALLFAPRSGKETRERMRMKAEDMKHQAEGGMTEIKESLDRSIKEAQDLKKRLSTTMSSTDRKADQPDRESAVLSTWEEEV